MINKDIELAFSALADSLGVQLKRQGVKCKNISKYQKLVNGILTLKIHGYVSESQCHKICQRIFNDIMKNSEIEGA